MTAHTDWLVAGRSFTAKCGHKIRKGESYRRFKDYHNYNVTWISECADCANGEATT